MIIYSVTISIEAAVRVEWLDWMQQHHIPTVMSTGYFLENHIQELIDPEPQEGTYTFNIQYVCKSMTEYEAYMENEAKVLQEMHISRFHDKFVAFKTLLRRF